MFLVVCFSALLAGGARGQNILPEKAKSISFCPDAGRETFLFPVVPAWEVSSRGKTGRGIVLPEWGVRNGVVERRPGGTDTGRTGGWVAGAMSGFREGQGGSGGVAIPGKEGLMLGTGNVTRGLGVLMPGMDRMGMEWWFHEVAVEWRMRMPNRDWRRAGFRASVLGTTGQSGEQWPAYGAVVPADRVATHFGFFCKRELELEKTIRLPLRFRLGSLEYCNRLEGK